MLDFLWRFLFGKAPEELLIESSRSPADIRRDIEEMVFVQRTKYLSSNSTGLSCHVNEWAFRFISFVCGGRVSNLYTWELLGRIHRHRKGTLLHGNFFVHWQAKITFGPIFVISLITFLKILWEATRGGSWEPLISFAAILVVMVFSTRFLGSKTRAALEGVRASLEEISKRRNSRSK